MLSWADLLLLDTLSEALGVESLLRMFQPLIVTEHFIDLDSDSASLCHQLKKGEIGVAGVCNGGMWSPANVTSCLNRFYRQVEVLQRWVSTLSYSLLL